MSNIRDLQDYKYHMDKYQKYKQESERLDKYIKMLQSDTEYSWAWNEWKKFVDIQTDVIHKRKAHYMMAKQKREKDDR